MGRIKAIIDNKDILFLEQILTHDISNEQKLLDMYKVFNFEVLKYSLEIYKKANNSDSEKIKRILKNFINISSSYSEEKNISITLEQYENRMFLIKMMNDILESNKTDYDKALELMKVCPSIRILGVCYKSILETDYSKFITFDRDEFKSKVLFIKEKYENYEASNIISNCNYLVTLNDYYENKDYATFVINYYINSKTNKSHDEIYEELGIDEEVFNYCIETIKELDDILYKLYENKFISKRHGIREKRKAIIKRLSREICSCRIQEIIPKEKRSDPDVKFIIYNNNNYSELDFLNVVPFENYDNIFEVFMDYFGESEEPIVNSVVNYMTEKGLRNWDFNRPFNKEAAYNQVLHSTKVEITEEMHYCILAYLEVRNIPLINKTYVLASEAYIRNQMKFEEIANQPIEKEKLKTLIPTVNKGDNNDSTIK